MSTHVGSLEQLKVRFDERPAQSIATKLATRLLLRIQDVRKPLSESLRGGVDQRLRSSGDEDLTNAVSAGHHQTRSRRGSLPGPERTDRHHVSRSAAVLSDNLGCEACTLVHSIFLRVSKVSWWIRDIAAQVLLTSNVFTATTSPSADCAWKTAPKRPFAHETDQLTRDTALSTNSIPCRAV